MSKELVANFSNPDYPVVVNFIELDYEHLEKDWMRWCDCVEIMVINYGEITIESSDKLYNVRAGQAVLINQNVDYRISMNPNESLSYYSLIFSSEYVLTKEEQNSLSKKYYGPITQKEKYGCVVLDEANLHDESVLDKINTIIAINHTRKLGYEMTTKGYICLLWVAFLEMAVRNGEVYNSKNLPNQDELRVITATGYIQEYYQDPITLEDIAERIHVSRNECCRCFKRVLSISPIDYLIKVRVYYAARLIYKNPTSFDTVSELAFTVGFNSASYFNKQFKHYFKCTPTEFKSKLKTAPAEVLQLYDNLEDTIKVD